MSGRFHLFAVVMVWVSIMVDAGAQAKVASVPDRPVSHILDQARWLSPDQKESVTGELSHLFSEHDVDMYLVTLEKLPPQGAETYARRLGMEWSRSPVWCVVFQVPGDPAGFHVEAEGVEIDHRYIDQAVKEAVRRARRENTEKERALAALRECSESLRFIHASKKRSVEKSIERRKQIQGTVKKTGKRKKLIIAGAAAAGVMLLVGLIGLILFVRSKRRVYAFPDTSWRTRFKAPHSGGGGIVVNYRSKRLRSR